MKLDPMLRAEIVATVRETMREVLEGADEIYLSPEQLAERFSFLPIGWIRKNGYLLPRECAIVTINGKQVKTNDGYPLHKIQRMVREGKLKNLVRTKDRQAADAACTTAE